MVICYGEKETAWRKIMQGTTSSQRRRGRPRTRWQDNITKWTGLTGDRLLRSVEDRRQCRKIIHETAVSSTCHDITGASLVVGPSPSQAPSSGTRYQLTSVTHRWVPTPSKRLWKLISSRSTSVTSALGALRNRTIQIYIWQWHWSGQSSDRGQLKVQGKPPTIPGGRQ